MSLHGDYDPDNIFAKILRGEIPCAKVYEDDICLSFMDAFPQSNGHTLVIPKAVTARNFLELPTDMIGPYMQRVQMIAKGVTKALSPEMRKLRPSSILALSGPLPRLSYMSLFVFAKAVLPTSRRTTNEKLAR